MLFLVLEILIVFICCSESNTSKSTSLVCLLVIFCDAALTYCFVSLSTVDTPMRGSLWITLRSPLGTVSRFQEPHHDQHANIFNWRFSSIICWGESPIGNWTLEIVNQQVNNAPAVWRAWHVLVRCVDSIRILVCC